MSTYDTNLDDINHICYLVEEIIELSNNIDSLNSLNLKLIRSKASTIKKKAQKMENRLREYKTAIESLGFKRVKEKRRKQ